MHNIVFKAYIRSEADRPHYEYVLRTLLETLVQHDMDWLTRHPNTPPLYKSGVYYQEESDTDEWKEIPDVIEDGEGDCEDLACWRCAELRKQGQKADPYLSYQVLDDGTHMYHVRVDRGGGKLEDPSRILGMGMEDVGAKRLMVSRLNRRLKDRERVSGMPTSDVRIYHDDKHLYGVYESGGFQLLLRIPLEPIRNMAVNALYDRGILEPHPYHLENIVKGVAHRKLLRHCERMESMNDTGKKKKRPVHLSQRKLDQIKADQARFAAAKAAKKAALPPHLSKDVRGPDQSDEDQQPESEYSDYPPSDYGEAPDRSPTDADLWQDPNYDYSGNGYGGDYGTDPEISDTGFNPFKEIAKAAKSTVQFLTKKETWKRLRKIVDDPRFEAAVTAAVAAAGGPGAAQQAQQGFKMLKQAETVIDAASSAGAPNQQQALDSVKKTYQAAQAGDLNAQKALAILKGVYDAKQQGASLPNIPPADTMSGWWYHPHYRTNFEARELDPSNPAQAMRYLYNEGHKMAMEHSKALWR